MKVGLKKVYVASVRGGGDTDHKVVHVGNYDTFGDHRVERRNIYDKE